MGWQKILFFFFFKPRKHRKAFHILQFLWKVIYNFDKSNSESSQIYGRIAFIFPTFSQVTRTQNLFLTLFLYLLYQKRCHYIISEKYQNISLTAYIIVNILPSTLQIQLTQRLHMVLKESLFFLLILNRKSIFLKRMVFVMLWFI